MNTILIIDDDENQLQILDELLTFHQINVITATNGNNIIETIIKNDIKVIILDVFLPGSSGYDLCKEIRSNVDSYIPILFVTAVHDNIKDISYGLSIGGDDYIRKPFSQEEFLARVNVFLRLKRYTDQLENTEDYLKKLLVEKTYLNKELMKKNDLLNKAKQRFYLLSIKDYGTMLYNKRYFYQQLNSAVQRCKRYDELIFIILLDLDNFKSINDVYGHECGDLVLKEVSVTLKETLRKSDILARFGGEEFIIMVYRNDFETIKVLVERLRNAVEMLRISYNDKTVTVTASFGVSYFPNATIQNKYVSTLIRQADLAMYEAKKAGKNRWIISYEDKN